MKPVTIIGMGLSPQDLTARHLKIIEQADILVGGKRLLEHFQDTSAQKVVIGKDLDTIFKFVESRMEKQTIVVLASGDPLFYGIGARMVQTLGPQNVIIHPNISSISAAFARIKEPWSDVRILSLHGKKNDTALFRTLQKANMLAILTDPKRNPAWLAAQLINKEWVNFKICVLEALGSPDENFNWYSLEEAAGRQFAEPNLVILKRRTRRSDQDKQIYLGTPDDWYDHQQGLITKAEVRAVTISKLRLCSDHILWDLGAGSGSVSVEASLFVTKGKIYAVEKNPARVEQIKNNKRHFEVDNLEVIASVMPEALVDLPRPDRIFIGGGGKDLAIITKTAVDYLKPDGILVINTVLIPNVEAALKTLKQNGFQTEIVQVQISRGQDMPWGERLEAQNPVWIISGLRSAQ